MSDATTSHIGRRLTAVPDQQVERGGEALAWIHSVNGAHLMQREALHHIKHARERGNEELEKAFEDVFRAAERAEKAARG